MNPDEYYTYEDRAYVSPTVTRDEQLGFVDALRDTINANSAKANTQTQALGTNISPNFGGLSGSGGYFAQRYQTTPVEARANTLRATAQADALNKLMKNELTQIKKRYTNAYNAAQKRSSARSGGYSSGGYSGGGGKSGSTDDDNTSGWNGTDFVEDIVNNPVPYVYAYRVPYKDATKMYIDNTAPRSESNNILAQLGAGSAGQSRVVNGVRYVWSDEGQYGPTWYRTQLGY